MDFASGDNLNFIAALALHQAKRDKAIGLTHVTKNQKGLIWYYNVKKQELFTLTAQISFKYGAIQQIDKRMADIMSEAENAVLERKRELLLEAMNLKEQANRIKNGR